MEVTILFFTVIDLTFGSDLNEKFILSSLQCLGKEYKFVNALEILDKGIELQPDNHKLFYKAVIYANEISDKNLVAKYLQKGLELNYEEHIKIFEYKTELVNDKEILSLLQNFRRKEDEPK